MHATLGDMTWGGEESASFLPVQSSYFLILERPYTAVCPVCNSQPTYRKLRVGSFFYVPDLFVVVWVN